MICMGSGVAGTVIGYVSVALLPHEIALGLIFMNPLSLRCCWRVLRQGLRSSPYWSERHWASFHLITPDLDLLLTGAVGGSLAFL